jgi:hypothetical protein
MRHPERTKIGWAIIAYAALFLILLLVATDATKTMANTMREWRLLPSQETYTELYFSDPLALPKKIERGDSVSFSFVIGNREGKTMNYLYRVSLSPDDAPSLVLTSSATKITDGSSKAVSVKLSFVSSPGPSTIVVSLPESGNEIRFHVNQP